MEVHDIIITAGAVVGALLTIGAVIFKVVKWFLDHKKQENELVEIKRHHEEDVARINDENTLICYALSACLDGLIQLGANHTVPIAKNKLDKYLNKQAHNWAEGGKNEH